MEFGKTLKMKYWRLQLWNMDSTNGQEFLHYCKENLQNNVSKGGINGLIQVLKKHNGVVLKTKNYYNLLEFFLHNGEL